MSPIRTLLVDDEPLARSLLRELLARCGATPRQVLAIGLGVPGPVDFEHAQLVAPPLMPEWDGFSIRDDLRADYAAPVFVDNDVNLMALGELWRPRFFNRGIAVHGSQNIPPWPDSHGCARLSNAAIDMVWAADLMPVGSRVLVR